MSDLIDDMINVYQRERGNGSWDNRYGMKNAANLVLGRILKLSATEYPDGRPSLDLSRLLANFARENGLEDSHG